MLIYNYNMSFQIVLFKSKENANRLTLIVLIRLKLITLFLISLIIANSPLLCKYIAYSISIQTFSKDKSKQLIFHSDLGFQYTSNDLKDLYKEFYIV